MDMGALSIEVGSAGMNKVSVVIIVPFSIRSSFILVFLSVFRVFPYDHEIINFRRMCISQHFNTGNAYIIKTRGKKRK